VIRKNSYCHVREAQTYFRGVRPKNHYMYLQMLILHYISYFSIDSLLLGTTEYPHTHFTVAKVFSILGITEYPYTMLHLATL
jgi:hypothetical protein